MASRYGAKAVVRVEVTHPKNKVLEFGPGSSVLAKPGQVVVKLYHIKEATMRLIRSLASAEYAPNTKVVWVVNGKRCRIVAYTASKVAYFVVVPCQNRD